VPTGTASSAIAAAETTSPFAALLCCHHAARRARWVAVARSVLARSRRRFTGHHALLCRLHRDRITGFDAAVADLDERIAGKAGRWQREADLLKSLPGFGDVVAWAWLGEIGPAPHLHFSSHEKLASWVSLCPGNNISARKRKHGRTGDLHQDRGGEARPDCPG